VPVEDRRELLASASEIVNAIAPELIEERRREANELEKKRRKGRKFWRR
jgi:predicted outer membrane lipoprotein